MKFLSSFLLLMLLGALLQLFVVPLLLYVIVLLKQLVVFLFLVLVYILSDLLHMIAISSILKNFYAVGIMAICVLHSMSLMLYREKYIDSKNKKNT